MAWERLRNHSTSQCMTYLNKIWIYLLLAGCVTIYLHHRKYKETNTINRLRKFDDIKTASQNDSNLIRFIRNNILVPPDRQKYNLTNLLKSDYSQHQQGKYLKQFFKDKKNGTFIEAGALDGETDSNTLNLELELNWTGLLIEPNPQRYPKLLTKHRKAYSANCCISPSVKPAKFNISIDEPISHLVGYFDKGKHTESAEVECFPLFSLMAGMNLTSLDFLSLDLESIEVKVLQTLPWDKINIKTLLIEAKHVPEGEEYLKKFMAERNYSLVKQLYIDYFFVKKI